MRRRASARIRAESNDQPDLPAHIRLVAAELTFCRPGAAPVITVRRSTSTTF
jgi:hypothetical protein